MSSRSMAGTPRRESAGLEALASELAALHAAEGSPSTRELAEQLSISHETVHRVLRCRTAPSWRSLEMVVLVLHGDVEKFHELWRRASDAKESGRERPTSSTQVPPQLTSDDRRGPSDNEGPIGSTIRPAASFLDQLSVPDRDRLLALGVVRTVRARHVFHRQGEQAEHVIVLLQGAVVLEAGTQAGTTTLLALRTGGDIVGELSVVDDGPQETTARALTAVIYVMIPSSAFIRFITTRQDASMALLRVLMMRQRDSDRRRVSAAVPVRLARLLLQLGVSHGDNRLGRGIRIDLPLTQAELAKLIGASQESTARALRRLREAEVITTGRRRLVILDSDGLQVAAEY